MECLVSLKQSRAPALAVAVVTFVSVMLLVALAYWWCALWVACAGAVEGWLLWRKEAPAAFFIQDMRWWQVDAAGALHGPRWLHESSRVGTHWISLRLYSPADGVCCHFLGHWCVAGENWRQMRWHIRRQSRELDAMPKPVGAWTRSLDKLLLMLAAKRRCLAGAFRSFRGKAPCRQNSPAGPDSPV